MESLQAEGGLCLSMDVDLSCWAAPARPQPWTSTHQAASNISATWLQAVGTYEADPAASGDTFMILFASLQT